MAPSSYTINVPQPKIDALKQKLANATFPDELESAEWSQGVPLADIKRLAHKWRDDYDWRTTEAGLNKSLNHYRTTISVDGFPDLKVHFVHHQSPNPNAIPLLFVHGWPGSFVECLKIKKLLFPDDGSGLTPAGANPDFHLIAPSLPNFGFSSGAKSSGFGLKQYASVLHALMQQLGYTQYVTQAGDWGYWITRAMGHLFPESVKASHYNMIYASPPSWASHPLLALQHKITPYTAAEKAGIARTDWFKANSKGYNVIQSSRPQTVGYAVADSPIALLAWIYEKMRDWTDSFPWTDQEILDWVSVYWFSEAGPAAPQRIYYEVTKERDDNFTYWGVIQSTSPSVKLGLTYNPKELEIFPRAYGRTLGDVVFEKENEHGGHFYAHEHPEWLVRDLREMFGRTGGAFGAVEGKNGYS